MEKEWVDFKAVKEAVTIKMALDHYAVRGLRKVGDEMRGPCPIHKNDTSRSFHANLSKNAFNCFSCKARGNVLDFVAALEKCSVRDAALKLYEQFIKEECESTPAEVTPAPAVIKSGIYEHFKGNSYMVLSIALHSETKEPLVIYRALYGDYLLSARPLEMFTESVERGGYSGPRFKLVKEL